MGENMLKETLMSKIVDWFSKELNETLMSTTIYCNNPFYKRLLSKVAEFQTQSLETNKFPLIIDMLMAQGYFELLTQLEYYQYSKTVVNARNLLNNFYLTDCSLKDCDILFNSGKYNLQKGKDAKYNIINIPSMGKKVSTDVTDFLTEEFIDNKFILSNNGNKKRLYIPICNIPVVLLCFSLYNDKKSKSDNLCENFFADIEKFYNVPVAHSLCTIYKCNKCFPIYTWKILCKHYQKFEEESFLNLVSESYFALEGRAEIKQLREKSSNEINQHFRDIIKKGLYEDSVFLDTLIQSGFWDGLLFFDTFWYNKDLFYPIRLPPMELSLIDDIEDRKDFISILLRQKFNIRLIDFFPDIQKKDKTAINNYRVEITELLQNNSYYKNYLEPIIRSKIEISSIHALKERFDPCKLHADNHTGTAESENAPSNPNIEYIHDLESKIIRPSDDETFALKVTVKKASKRKE